MARRLNISIGGLFSKIRSLLLILVLTLSSTGLSFFTHGLSVHADGLHTISGDVTNADDGYSAVQGAGVYLLLPDTNQVVASTVTGDGGAYSIGYALDGRYDLRIDAGTGSGLQQYLASVDLLSDIGNFNVVLSSSPSQDVTFRGKILVNGEAPWDYFRNNLGGTWREMFISSPSYGGELYIRQDTGEFHTSVPKSSNYDLRTNLYSAPMSGPVKGFYLLDPKLSLQKNTYRVYNLNLQEGSSPGSITVKDQCGNVLPAVFTRVEIVAPFHLNDELTGVAQYLSFLGETDSNGQANFGVQPQNRGGIIRMLYNDGSQTYAKDVFILNQKTNYTAVINLRVCNNPPVSDTTAPTLGVAAWSANPKAITASSTLTIPATDNEGGSGVNGGEYFIGTNDPGQGNGATMGWDGTNLTTTFGTDFQPGVYQINVRAMDGAGNWSAVTSDYLVVYDPSGPADVTGKKKFIPSMSNGDVLPGLTSDPNQKDKVDIGFDVAYAAGGQIATSSKLSLSYDTGKCNGNNQTNCHHTTLNATNFIWLAIYGTNNSQGDFLATATLTVDGVTTTNPVKVQAVDGNRLTPAADDTYVVKIYASGADPNTATPIYQVTAGSGASVKIQ